MVSKFFDNKGNIAWDIVLTSISFYLLVLVGVFALFLRTTAGYLPGFLSGILPTPNDSNLISLMLYLIILLIFFELSNAYKKDNSDEIIGKKIQDIHDTLDTKIDDLRNSKIRKGVGGDDWVWEDGLLNIGNSPNVTLRIKTLQQILDSFKVHTEKYPEIMRETAKKIGTSFGETLYRDINKKTKVSTLDIQQRIDTWRKYDSDTGMGRFDTSELHVDIEHKTISGFLKIHNSFITNGRTDCTGKKECIFFEGYLKGVFDSFVLNGMRKKIIVEETDCAAEKHENGNVCKFSIKIQDPN